MVKNNKVYIGGGSNCKDEKAKKSFELRNLNEIINYLMSNAKQTFI